MTRKKAIETDNGIYSYCSWCMGRHYHVLVEKNYLTRNVYKCTNCQNYTVQCRVCDCMARDKPNSSIAESVIQKIKEGWSSEYCAAHDGSISSWDNLDLKFARPSEFKKLLERNNEWNMVKVTGGAIGSAVIGAGLLATCGLAAGPIAASLGSLGVLGTAGTGTAIATLHGAALTTASLAAIGMGSMATGSLVVAAAGGALGAGLGLQISNSYLGELKDFDIKCVDYGNNNLPAILFINGFLQKSADINDWLKSVETEFPDNPKYHVIWDSKNIADLSKIFTEQAAAYLGRQTFKVGLKRVTPIQWAMAIHGLIVNPWHQALNNAGKAGALLADILSRTIQHNSYIIMGHSLGCRVAYYAARALATRDHNIIDSMYLLSGATGVNEWYEIANSITGNIYNFYAPDDFIVGPIYKCSSVGIAEDTIGTSQINCNNTNIYDYNVTDILKKYEHSSRFYHMRYKDAFREMIHLTK